MFKSKFQCPFAMRLSSMTLMLQQIEISVSSILCCIRLEKDCNLYISRMRRLSQCSVLIPGCYTCKWGWAQRFEDLNTSLVLISMIRAECWNYPPSRTIQSPGIIFIVLTPSSHHRELEITTDFTSSLKTCSIWVCIFIEASFLCRNLCGSQKYWFWYVYLALFSFWLCGSSKFQHYTSLSLYRILQSIVLKDVTWKSFQYSIRNRIGQILNIVKHYIKSACFPTLLPCGSAVILIRRATFPFCDARILECVFAYATVFAANGRPL